MTSIVLKASKWAYWFRAQAFECALCFVWFTLLPLGKVCERIKGAQGEEFSYRITIHQYHYLFLVGLAKIAISIGLAFALAQIWHPAIAALFGAVAFIVASGGIHLDGLADTVDALFAYGKDKYEIMREPQIGAIGAAYLMLYLWLFIPMLAYNLYWLITQPQVSWFHIIMLAHVAMLPKLNCYAVLCLAEAKEPIKRDKHMELDSSYPFWSGPLTAPWTFVALLAAFFSFEIALSNFDLGVIGFVCALLALCLYFNFRTLPGIRRNLGFLNGDVFGTMICILDLAGQITFALIFVRAI